MSRGAATVHARPADLGPLAEPVFLALSVPGAAVLGWLRGWAAALGLLAVVWPPAVAAWGYAAVRRRRPRLELDDGQLTHVGLAGRRTAIPRQAVRAVHVGRVDVGVPRPTGLVVVAGRGDTVLLALWEPRWDVDALLAFLAPLARVDPMRAGAAGTPVREAREAYVGLRVPFPVAHPMPAVLGGLAGWLAYAAVVLGVVVAMAG
jgi:hypothetical protein